MDRYRRTLTGVVVLVWGLCGLLAGLLWAEVRYHERRLSPEKGVWIECDQAGPVRVLVQRPPCCPARFDPNAETVTVGAGCEIMFAMTGADAKALLQEGG